MLPYSRGIILDNTNNYGIVKTETVFGFGPPNHDNYVKEAFNNTEPLEWIFAHSNFQRRSLSDTIESPRALKTNKKATKATTAAPKQINKKKKKSSKKADKIDKNRLGRGKINKCVYKIVKEGKKKRRGSGGGGGNKLKHKKYILPMIIGLLAAKSLLIPVALKALAFLSAKGLMMGFFSTVLASFLSLKGMFDHSHGYQNRKDDTKTQVEIIQVPTKTEDHYYDEHYKRNDFVPIVDKYEVPMYSNNERK